MPKIVKPKHNTVKTNIWKWNPDNSNIKYSHKEMPTLKELLKKKTIII